LGKGFKHNQIAMRIYIQSNGKMDIVVNFADVLMTSRVGLAFTDDAKSVSTMKV